MQSRILNAEQSPCRTNLSLGAEEARSGDRNCPASVRSGTESRLRFPRPTRSRNATPWMAHYLRVFPAGEVAKMKSQIRDGSRRAGSRRWWPGQSGPMPPGPVAVHPRQWRRRPAAGRPSAPVTFISTVDLVCPAWSLVVTLIEVSVDTLCALAAVTGSTSIASAIPSPATNSSRRLRRFMPLTCTCSKSPEESRIAKSRIARLPKRRRLLYLARARCGQPARRGFALKPAPLPAQG